MIITVTVNVAANNRSMLWVVIMGKILVLLKIVGTATILNPTFLTKKHVSLNPIEQPYGIQSFPSPLSSP